jgi:hypothetical protein
LGKLWVIIPARLFNEVFMSKLLKATLLSAAIALLLGACATFTPPPTATPVPSETPVPLPSATLTAAPPPTDAGATVTPDIFMELNPASAPLAAWNKIPIMPGALAGDGNDTSYYFTTQATTAAIQAFYDKELARMGYSTLAVGNGAGGAIVLFYQAADGATLDISLFTQGDTVLVMFVK